MHVRVVVVDGEVTEINLEVLNGNWLNGTRKTNRNKGVYICFKFLFKASLLLVSMFGHQNDSIK